MTASDDQKFDLSDIEWDGDDLKIIMHAPVDWQSNFFGLGTWDVDEAAGYWLDHKLTVPLTQLQAERTTFTSQFLGTDNPPWVSHHSALLHRAWAWLQDNGFFHRALPVELYVQPMPAPRGPVGWVACCETGPRNVWRRHIEADAYAATVTVPTYGTLFLGTVDSMVTLLHEAAHVHVFNRARRATHGGGHGREWRAAYRKATRMLFPRAAYNALAAHDLRNARTKSQLDMVVGNIVNSCYTMHEMLAGPNDARLTVSEARMVWAAGDTSYRW